MTDNDMTTLADRLCAAAESARPIPQPGFSMTSTQAYEVQRRLVEKRLASGERRLGIKMGLTSKAKMAQVGVDEMSWGRLTDGMCIEDGGSISRSRMIHPRAEPEIAFLLKAPLKGKVTPLQAWAAVGGVAAAVEIIDSRYESFKFRAADAIADNTSSCGVVLGPWFPPTVDVSNLGMILEVNGQAREIGSSAAILGHPSRSLVAAAELVTRYGGELLAGDILMSGGATAAVALQAGDRVRLRAETLGGCVFSIIQ
ncbi:2-keto-4-pentenoate hydratase [Bordetella genomosp. 12]|uniref:4-oxalocrotonate decarboxylase n=1 Tax=Bordetella genomosp. 12 TaxID=463035 RepID=A0A261VCB2_9BORD|nr:fumarylacetoacetate hydrolase family protein [Bordetella genomosp. 12]OZI71655.1 4-oxalocrotonate decarboxylase [Bordetella genomosp. 12]